MSVPNEWHSQRTRSGRKLLIGEVHHVGLEFGVWATIYSV